MRPPRRVLAPALTAIALLAAASPAAAADGRFYQLPPQRFEDPGSFLVVHVPAENRFEITVPEGVHEATAKFRAWWSCPASGSRIVAVRFAALRSAPATSLLFRIHSGEAVAHAWADATLPQSPSGGRVFEGPGLDTCDASLRLTLAQRESLARRTYWIGQPTATVEDLMPPGVHDVRLPAGWITGAGFPVTWRTSDNFGWDGVAGHLVTIDGLQRWAGPRDAQSAEVELRDLPDGAHGVAVVALGDGTGDGLFEGGQIRVDRTPPSVAVGPFDAVAADAMSMRTAAADVTSGVAGRRVEANAATDGGEGGGWQPLAESDGPGVHDAVAGLRHLQEGTHRLRVVASDVAGNVTVAPAGAVVVDRTGPMLDAAITPGAGEWVNANWTASDRLSKVREVLVEWFDGTRWSTLQGLGGRAGATRVPTAGLADGRWPLRVVAIDGAGNRTASAATVITRSGLHASLRVAGARVAVTSPGARVHRVVFGRTLRITGALADTGRPLGGAIVVVRDPAGRLLGSGPLAADGRFAVRVAPRASDPLHLSVVADQSELPLATTPAITVQVRPRVTLRASARTARALGAAVAFTGRVAPGAAYAGVKGRPPVVLEWLDPLRGAWRPVLTGKARRDGRYRFRWRFGVRGLTIPMRARVTSAPGWPYLPAASPVVRIVVR